MGDSLTDWLGDYLRARGNDWFGFESVFRYDLVALWWAVELEIIYEICVTGLLYTGKLWWSMQEKLCGSRGDVVLKGEWRGHCTDNMRGENVVMKKPHHKEKWLLASEKRKSAIFEHKGKIEFVVTAGKLERKRGREIQRRLCHTAWHHVMEESLYRILI